MSRKVTRRFSVLILSFLMLFFFTGCVIVLNNNFGHHIVVDKTNKADHTNIEKAYEGTLDAKIK